MLPFAVLASAWLQELPGTSFGLDPTMPSTRFETVFEHADVAHGGSRDTLTSRFDWALTDRFVLRADLPLVYADPIGASSDHGLGDLRLQAGYRAFEDPVFAMFFGAGVVLDTADGEALGSGHDRLVLHAAGAGALPEMRSHVFESVEHVVSFDGSGEQPGVAYTQIDVHMVTEWSPSTWTRAGGELVLDWKGGEQAGLNLQAQLGWRLHDGPLVWIEPSVGVFGEDVPGIVDWSVAVGMRWFF